MKPCRARLLPTWALLWCAMTSGIEDATAADIHVTSFDDVPDITDGTCTLREAVVSANSDVALDTCERGDGSDRILLATGTYTLDLVSGTGEDIAFDGDLDLRGPLEIRGVSAGYTVIDGVAEQSTERVLHAVGGTEPVVIRNLRLTGGNAELGGAIRVETAASMTLIDMAVDGSEAEDGGGIFNAGTLALVRTRIESNKATDNGGGIASIGTFSASDSLVIGNDAGQRGGGVASQVGGTVRIERSTIIDNEAGLDGGGLWVSFIDEFDLLYSQVEGNRAIEGGGLFVEGDSTYQVLHSALISNAASAQGGGLHASGIVFVRHSTLALNTAPEGGGGGAFSSGDNVLFDSATISANTGGGVLNDSGAFFEFSLLADNEGGNCLGAAPGAGKLNLDDGNTCRFPTDDPNRPQLVETDPMLGPLADHNGPTPTFALLPGSPAVDAISSNDKPNCGGSMGMASPPPDQRGYPRGYPPSMVNGQLVYFCDIGAFEAHAPFVVDSTADEPDLSEDDGLCLTASGTCTLRAAVQQANATLFGLDEIELSAGTFTLTLLGAEEDEAATGDLDLRGPVIVRGAAPGQTVIDAEGDRVFEVLSLKAPQLQASIFRDLTLTTGQADGGAALRIAGRPVRLERTILSDNDSSASGGGVLCDTGCQLTVVDSRLVNNSAATYGAGIATNGEDNVVVIERSELSGNIAMRGGGALDAFAVTVRNTTISDNHGEGVLESADDNDFGGGIRAHHAIVEDSTITGNTTATHEAGGLFVQSSGVLANSIVFGNRSVDSVEENCAFLSGHRFSSAGYNLTGTNGFDCGLDQTGDLPDTDPLLGPLANNRALTRTHALLPESPAIDAGNDANCPLTDQRGFFRPEDGDGDGTATCDIGAFEALGADLAIAISDSPDPAVVDDDVTYTVTITNNGPGPATGVQVSASLPPELSFVSADAGAAGCSESGGAVDCEVGDLPAGETIDATIVATASQSGSVSVSASVTAAEADAIPSDNSVSETTTVNADGGNGGSGGGGSGSGGSGGGGALAPLLLAMLAFSRRLSRWAPHRLPGRQRTGADTIGGGQPPRGRWPGGRGAPFSLHFCPGISKMRRLLGPAPEPKHVRPSFI